MVILYYFLTPDTEELDEFNIQPIPNKMNAKILL